MAVTGGRRLRVPLITRLPYEASFVLGMSRVEGAGG